MSTYCIYQFGLAGELIATKEIACASDDCAVAEMASTRHAAPALELWHGERLLMRAGGPPWEAAANRRALPPSRPIPETGPPGKPARSRSKSRPVKAKISPYEDPSIAMFAHVVGLLPQGGRRVRLANDHELDVLGVKGRQSEVSLIGDLVTVTLAPGQLHGWRLA